MATDTRLGTVRLLDVQAANYGHSADHLNDELRAIIRRDGRTIYAIETAAGVPRGGVGRFLSGERGLTTDTLDRLAVVLGLRVVGPGETPRGEAIR